MASAKIVFDNRIKRENNRYPIIIRIDHKSSWYPIITGVSCTEKQWDEDNLKITKSKDNPNYGRDNATIFNAISTAQKFIADNITRLNSISCKDLRNEIRVIINGKKVPEGDKSKKVGTLIDDLVQDLEKAGRIKYARGFQTMKASFITKYAPNIEFKDVTPALLSSYQNWCLSNGMTYGGISVYMRAIRTIFNMAIRDKIINIEHYPFRAFKIKKVKTAKRAIKKNLIDELRKIKLERGSIIWHHWNYFRFYFNAMGMNYIDLAFLTMANIESGRLIYTRKKGHRPYNMALTTEMKEILGYYTKGKGKKELIFPILEDVIESEDKKFIRTTYENRQGDHVKYLNLMAQQAGIKQRITTYTIRHSWASGMRDKGAPISAIKEGMGHNNMGTTEIYLSQIEDKIVDDWNEKFLDS